MSDENDNKNLKLIKFCRENLTWKNLRYFCCQTRKDIRIFWFSYLFILILLFIIFMIAFLYKSTIDIYYLKWYNDSCSILSSNECDRSLHLYCSTTTERCTCLDNMFWNGSFCDCSNGMYFMDNSCYDRLPYGKTCNTQIDSCMEYLICSTNTNTCDCPSNSYYNQTTCNLKLAFNATQSCTLSSQCVTGLICR